MQSYFGSYWCLRIIALLIPQTFFCCNFPVQNYRRNARTNFCCNFCLASSGTDLCQTTLPNAKITAFILAGMFCCSFALMKFQNYFLEIVFPPGVPIFILVTIVFRSCLFLVSRRGQKLFQELSFSQIPRRGRSWGGRCANLSQIARQICAKLPVFCFAHQRNQESPRQTKPKKGPKQKVHEFRPFLWILVFFLKKTSTIHIELLFRNAPAKSSWTDFFWFGLPGPLLKEGCAKLSQICREFESQFRTILCKYPFSNVPFLKFLTFGPEARKPICSKRACSQPYLP